MTQEPRRVRVEELDWRNLFPFLRIFRSFRQAIHPGKIGLALLLVVLSYLAGRGLDLIWGDQVHPQEFAQYATLSADQFDRWHAAQPQEQRTLPIFTTILDVVTESFGRLTSAAVRLDFGLTSPLRAAERDPFSVTGSLYELVLLLPGWLLRTHPVYLLLLVVINLVLVTVIGGAIARISAMQATRNQRVQLQPALRYVEENWVSYLLCPLLPVLTLLVMTLIMALLGLLFNAPVADIVGGVLFFVSLLLGVICALILLGLLLGGGMLYPAVAVDGADVFDAISRAGHYVLGRPWQLLFYTLVALVYGSITFLFLGTLIYLALLFTQRCTGWWVFTEAGGEVNRWEAILPAFNRGQLIFEPNWETLSVPGKIAAALVSSWVYLLLSVLAAYAISFFFTAYTWVYLLQRRGADGTEFDDVFIPTPPPTPADKAPVAEKVEPDQAAPTVQPPASQAPAAPVETPQVETAAGDEVATEPPTSDASPSGDQPPPRDEGDPPTSPPPPAEPA